MGVPELPLKCTKRASAVAGNAMNFCSVAVVQIVALCCFAKAKGEEPAELPQEVLDWLKRGYRKTAGNDSDSGGGESEEPPKKRRKEKKDEAPKSKSKKRSSSSEPPRRSAISKKVKQEPSETSKDDDTDKGKQKEQEFPSGGYKLDIMKNKKGDDVPCLYHRKLKTMLELDPNVTWKVKEDSEGISYIWDVANKNKTRTPCSEVANEVLSPHLLKGPGSH
eukprot:s631_g4.t1